MAIKFTEKNQDWENETTEYWFDVDGVSYCLADNNGDLSLLDSGRHNVNNDSLLATLSDIYTREL